MAFVDEATVLVKSGAGGSGSASFHSEPYKPRGGPDGGDGGRGGSVILEVSPGVRDLSWLAEHPHQHADAGGSGARNNRHGADGKDLVIKVPDGTVAYDERGFVADLLGEGARVTVARGGRGGRGNSVLAGPKNRAPKNAEPGEPPEEHRISLELRVIADVGLVGLPSAGKSTLLAALTAARPKIAAYPFTTLSPNLGVTPGADRFVLADVPGLIEGAHQGKGLGHRFLRHVSRCPVLACVVDLSSPDPVLDLRTVRAELGAYDEELARRPFAIVATKADLLDEETLAAVVDRLRDDGEVVVVSGVSGEGIDVLAERLGQVAAAAKETAAAGGGPTGASKPRAVILRPGRPEFTVTAKAGEFRVSGRNVERWVREADLDDPRSVVELQHKLAREGVEKQLAADGAKRGDTVVIGDRTFEFIPEGDA